MKIRKLQNKPTFLVFLLSAVYYGVCFFGFFFLVNNVLIELVTSGGVDLSKKSLCYLSIVSVIIGVASGARVWIFAKIDRRKLPPSD